MTSVIPFLPPLRPSQDRALLAMSEDSIGQVLGATGCGKTLIQIADALRQFLNAATPQTIAVVAPRILLAEQLSSEYLEHINCAHVMHVHSGETHHFSSTNPRMISAWVDAVEGHKLIFTTYHSLHRLQEANVKVNTIYFDEAHNSVSKAFFSATEHFSGAADRCYFFTATPKHSATVSKPGMNDADVYGKVICNISAPEMVRGGFIVPPQVHVKELPMLTKDQQCAERDSEHLLDTIDEHQISKILICAKATKQIISLVGESDFCQQLQERGYSYMYITAKTGGVIDGVKVNREVFFNTLNTWGKDNNKKFVVIHHSILSEGINVSGLEGVIFMRSMDYIGISQTIGRVIRLHHDDAAALRNGTITPGALHQYTKSFGLVCIPVYDKVGIGTAKKVQSVVDIVFRQGDAAVSVIKR